MAAKIIVFVLFLSFSRVNTQSAGVNSCTCDLNAGICDVNCCCDSDCSENDKKSFSTCVDQTNNVDTQFCVSQELVFNTNTQYTVNASSNGLFCIITDNYQSRNFYSEPAAFASITEFENSFAQNTYPVTVTASNNVYNFTDRTTYKSSDTMYTFYETTNVIGIFSMPAGTLNGYCSDNSAAAVYLVDKSTTCTRDITNIAVSCQTDPTLSAAVYYEKFKVANAPSLFAPSNTAEIIKYPLYTDPGLKVVTPVLPAKCTTVSGVVSDCTDTTTVPTPTYDITTQTCSNVVSKVSYVITYDNSGVSAVSVSFILKDVKQDNLPISQTFDMKFTKSGKTSTSYPRSGNPGYIFGKPVVAGIETTQSGTLAISLNSDPNNWLTALGTTDGSCDSSKRVPVTFGDNMRSGCTKQFDRTGMATFCQTLCSYAQTLLEGQNPPTHVAVFGNSAVTTTGDWVKILYKNKQSCAERTTTGRAGECSNIALGMDIQIIYANQGALANPQPKILGAAFVYDTPQNIYYQCIGAYCQVSTTNLTQNFQIKSSVTFADASAPAVAVGKEIPKFAVRLPFDFFYPFTQLSSATQSSPTTFLYVTVAILGIFISNL